VQDVVITGIGIACPLGVGREAVWSAVENRRSGVRVVDRLVEEGWPIPIAGEVPDFEPKQYVKPRKSLKVMSRETQLGFTAAALAWTDARIEDGKVDPERLGVVVGANMFRSPPADVADTFQVTSLDGQFDMAKWGVGMQKMYPLWMLKYLPNMTCCHIGIAYDARGPINTIVQGEISSLTAMIEATDVIARGHAEVMIAGATSTMLGPVDLSWHGGAGMSRNIKNPAAACRPFDAARDGSVSSEGAAMFVLESRQHAERRGAKILSQVLGYGRRHESGWPEKPPTGQAIRQSIEAALAMGNVAAKEVGHVSAHGLGAVEEDAIEAQAIAETLGDVMVTASKSFFGNLGASSGAAELAISLLGMQNGVVPPTLNYEEADPACPVNVVTSPQISKSPNVLAVSHTLTGQAVSLLVGS
jgi:3-oxoacyl-[acyl-carrier-protein] synthase II